MIEIENRPWDDNIDLPLMSNWIDDPSNVTKVINLVNNQDIEDMAKQYEEGL